MFGRAAVRAAGRKAAGAVRGKPFFGLAPLTTTQLVPKGQIPLFGAAGSVTRDPTWGCPIMRVTDGSDTAIAGARCGTVYADMMTLSSDNSLVASLIEDGAYPGSIMVRGFDPNNFVLGGTRYTLPASPGARAKLTGWSRSNPKVFWAPLSAAPGFLKIDFTNPASPTTTTYNFGGLSGPKLNGATSSGTQTLLSNDCFRQCSWSDDEDYFSGEVMASDFSTQKGFVVVRISTGTIIRFFTDSTNGINQGNILRSGTYFFYRPQSGTLGGRVFNYLTGASVGDLTFDGPDWFGSHYDVTATGVTATSRADGSIRYHDVSNVNTPTTLLPNPAFEDYYLSTGGTNYNNAAGKKAIIMVYMGTFAVPDVTDSRLYSGEFVEVALDGTGIRRWGRHYCVDYGTHPSGDNYFNLTRPNFSVDGRFICFTSNMGVNGAETDLYVVKLF